MSSRQGMRRRKTTQGNSLTDEAERVINIVLIYNWFGHSRRSSRRTQPIEHDQVDNKFKVSYFRASVSCAFSRYSTLGTLNIRKKGSARFDR